MMRVIKLAGASLLLASSFAQAADYVRWTGKDDTDATFTHVVSTLSTRLGVTFDPANFKSNEERDLAFTHFSHYLQTSGGTPVDAASIRIWTDRATGKLIQVEANVEKPQTLVSQQAAAQAEVFSRTGRSSVSSPRDIISDERLRTVIMNRVGRHEDRPTVTRDSQLVWSNGRLVSINHLAGKRGSHEVRVDILTGRVISSVYNPYPQDDEFQIEADLFPIYEEADAGVILPREHTVLKHLLPTVRVSTVDPFAPMRDTRYFESRMDTTAAATPAGRRAGFWSEALVRQRIATLASAVPEWANDFSNGGAHLTGRYCNIMMHPDALTKFTGINFVPKFSGHAFYDWRDGDNNGTTENELVVFSSYFGKPIESQAEAAARPATRHPFHDPVTYINEGFDDLQVYGGVNQFFDQLHVRGFSDPELSTRPFNAYLFNPDISMRDNAFYTNDTINFTTYSPKSDNAARNNTTIWHELGHGLMERLMGDAWGSYLHLADTGGLSEGMADFTADLVVSSVAGRTEFPGRKDLRIVNNTGFLLTNEVHDDGEAYGGAMHDILERAQDEWGVEGIHKMADLTLETMRLTRYHPHLTAADFFDHMVFADEMGRPGVREPGEMAQIINESLARRNFVRPGHVAANLSIKYNNAEVAGGTAGARDHEIRVELAETETKDFPLTYSVTDGESFQFHYPLKAKLFKANRGALQGAVHWVGEEQAPEEFTIAGPNQPINTTVTVTGKCDYINRPDGTCSDYVYFLLFDETHSTEKPIAKKRFYVRVKPKATP